MDGNPLSDDTVVRLDDSLLAPNMKVLDGNKRPAPPFPLDDLFGAFWSDWIKSQSASRSVPVDFIAMPLLSCAAALIGNSRQVCAGGEWFEPSVIWTAIVGSPSTRKTPALLASKKPLQEVEKDLSVGFDEKLRRWETEKEFASAKRDAWQADVKEAVKLGSPAPEMPVTAVEPDKPALPRIVVNDVTVEALASLLSANPRGVICMRDELSGWLGSFDRYSKGGERSLWLETFGAGSYTVDRKGTPAPLRIDRMSVSITGGLQPDKAVSLLMKGDDDGLCARFLLSWPDPVRPKMPGVSVDPEGVLRAFRRLSGLPMGSDDDGNPKPVTMQITRAASYVMEAWQDAMHDEAVEAVGQFGSHLGKLPSYVLRLALVTELMRWAAGDDAAPPPEVGAEAMQAACDFANGYLTPMAARVYGDAALAPAERGASQIARKIRKDRLRMVNASAIRREWRLPGLRDADAVKESLEVLCEDRWLFGAGARRGDSPGRSSSDYRVNPKVFG